jgi:hypothetical protein
MPERLHRPKGHGWVAPIGATYVGPGSRWDNPYRFRSRDALARVPALDGSAWEREDRISAAGMSHAFHHPGGKITHHDIRYMTLAECNELYRQALTAPTFEIHLQDGWGGKRLTVADARRDLAGRDLACRCPLGRACHADVLLEVVNTPEDGDRVTVDAAALAALTDIAYVAIETHAQVAMDTPDAKALHAKTVGVLRESLALARGALNITEDHREKPI